MGQEFLDIQWLPSVEDRLVADAAPVVNALGSVLRGLVAVLALALVAALRVQTPT